MVKRTLVSSVYSLAYDAENRLTAVSGSASATFDYDGDGNRVKGTVGGTTVYIGNYFEWTGSTSTMVKYYYAGSTRVAMRTGTGTNETGLLWLLGDHLGSTSRVANADGTPLANGEQRYKPWGEKRYPSGASGLPTTYRFTGQRQESSLGGTDGLYFYGARWLDPSLGRFVQPDSLIPGMDNPQRWDRLGYVLNNPLRYTDPSGHREAGPCERGEICNSDQGEEGGEITGTGGDTDIGGSGGWDDTSGDDDLGLELPNSNNPQAEKYLELIDFCKARPFAPKCQSFELPYTIGPSGYYLAGYEYWLNPNKLDGFDLFVDVAGIVGDAALLSSFAGDFAGIPVDAVATSIEIIGVVDAAYDLDAKELGKAGFLYIMKETRASRLLPLVGIAFNVEGILSNIRQAIELVPIYKPKPIYEYNAPP